MIDKTAFVFALITVSLSVAVYFVVGYHEFYWCLIGSFWGALSAVTLYFWVLRRRKV